jgi:GT2 family glycosyltransferase
VDPVPTSETQPKQEDLGDDGKTLVLTRGEVASAYTPTFSFIAAVHSPTAPQLTKCLEAIKAQLYPRWELCITYDKSTPIEIQAVLDRYAAEDPRIKVVPPAPDGPSAPALRSAFDLAKGEFIAIIDPNDELGPNALPHYVLALNQHRDADLVYGDEDTVDDAGKHSAPYFKPDWSPETLLNDMYLGHASIYRRSIVEELEPFRQDMGCGQEYDLALRVTERTDRIHHVSRVLCHRRIGRDANDTRATAENCQRTLEALRQAIARRGLRGSVEAHAQYPDHHIVHLRADPVQKVSIVIPTRDRADLLDRCLGTLFGLTTHPNFDVCVVDNSSREAATFEVLQRFERARPQRFRVVRRDIPFNFPALVNAGVAETDGALVVLLNNDTEVLDGSWLDEMAGYAQRPDIGAVGCVLLYPDGTVQHGGVTLIAGAVASNSHVGQPATAPGYFGRLLAQSNYAAVTAACMMVRREVFVEAGGFDEGLPVAYNDVDFCLRLLAGGYRNVCLGQVRLVHHESLSRASDAEADRAEGIIAEFAQMRERWATILDLDPYHSPNLRGIPPGNAPAEATSRWVGSSSPVLSETLSHLISQVECDEAAYGRFG